MNEIQRTYDRFCDFMEKNTLGAEIGCYTVAFTGLALAIRRVRPFSKFKKPSAIPNRFIKERKELVGTVQRIEPNGSLLMFQHKPLIDIPFIRSGNLPVRIAGINVSGHGISWLQIIVAGKEVTCIPVTKKKDFVECTVSLQQLTPDKKLKTINIGESLIEVGFATLTKPEEPAINDSYVSSYFHRLESAELRALKKQLGLKYYIKPTMAVLTNIANRITSFLKEQFTKKPSVPKVAIS